MKVKEPLQNIYCHTGDWTVRKLEVTLPGFWLILSALLASPFQNPSGNWHQNHERISEMKIVESWKVPVSWIQASGKGFELLTEEGSAQIAKREGLQQSFQGGPFEVSMNVALHHAAEMPSAVWAAGPRSGGEVLLLLELLMEYLSLPGFSVPLVSGPWLHHANCENDGKLLVELVLCMVRQPHSLRPCQKIVPHFAFDGNNACIFYLPASRR